MMSDTGKTFLESGLLPGVSVVICCYNSAEVIVPSMKALSSQKVPNRYGYEVILEWAALMDNTSLLKIFLEKLH